MTGEAPASAPVSLTPGERWARLELSRLRSARFSGGAIVTFGRASLRRSRDVREARPQLVGQSRRWMLGGALAWSAPALLGIQPWRRQWGPGLAWWAWVSLMLDWHLGMVETPSGTPRPLGLADALTLARAWLVPVVADTPSATLIGLAAVSDVIDGHLARRAGPTRAGRDLEGLVDACFTLAALRGVRRRKMLAGWPLAGEGLRLLGGVTYTVLVYFGRARAPQRGPLRAARMTTVVRAGGLLAASSRHPTAGNLLLGGGSSASVALLAWALLRRPRGGPRS